MLKRIVDTLSQKRVVLASGSPRRQELFEKLVKQSRYVSNGQVFDFRLFQGIRCMLCPSEFEEDLRPEDFHTFSDFVEATALGKVLEVEKRLKEGGSPPDLVIGADTMVTLNGTLYGKPRDEREAYETLKMYV